MAGLGPSRGKRDTQVNSKKRTMGGETDWRAKGLGRLALVQTSHRGTMLIREYDKGQS
jgi:hypothetical protein